MLFPGKRSRLILVVPGVALLCACAPWHPQAEVPTRVTAFDSTKTYRVTLRNGRKWVATHPRISGDSLTWVEPVPDDVVRMPPKHRGIELGEIARVEVQGSNVAGTILVLWLGAGALALVLAGGAHITGS
jgi:hypothetical protein